LPSSKSHVEESCFNTTERHQNILSMPLTTTRKAAKHHDAGHHEKAAHHAHTAKGHIIHARGHAEEAVKAHTAEHGKK
jgi:hypothetical protein